MKPIWADAATPDEAGELAAYLVKTEENLLDLEITNYPATKIMKASDGARNLVFMPVQQCQVWESLGINPEASEMEIAASLKALAHVLRFVAKANGEGEIYFLCAEARTQKFAEHNGFEKVNIPLYRMRLK